MSKCHSRGSPEHLDTFSMHSWLHLDINWELIIPRLCAIFHVRTQFECGAGNDWVPFMSGIWYVWALFRTGRGHALTQFNNISVHFWMIFGSIPAMLGCNSGTTHSMPGHYLRASLTMFGQHSGQSLIMHGVVRKHIWSCLCVIR
jgi:hypothetical protein